MTSGRFEDVPLLDEGKVPSGPRKICDGRAAAIDRMDRREHWVANRVETIINDRWY